MYEAVLFTAPALYIAFVGWYLGRPEASIYHPATYYLAVHGILFVVRPIFAYFLQYEAIYSLYQFTPSLSDKITALTGQHLACGLFVWASVRAGSAVPVFKMPSMAGALAVRVIPSFLVVAALCAPIGIYSTAVQLREATDDLTSMVFNELTGVATNTTAIGYVRDAAAMLPTLAVLLAWLFRFRLWSMVPFAMFLVARAAGGSRWAFITASGSMMLFYLWEKRRIWPPLRLVVLGMLALFAFTAIGQDRGLSIRALFTEQQAGDNWAAQATPLKFWEGMDYANMEYMEYFVWVVPKQSGTYDYFLANLQVLTEPIPRALWPGKPQGAPIKRFNLFDYGFPVGGTHTIAGEGWLQWGWLGIAIWSTLAGLLFGWIYQKFMRGPQTPFKVAAYLTFLPICINLYRDGVLFRVLSMPLFVILPIVFWWLAYRVLSERAKSRRQGLPKFPSARPVDII